MWIVFISLLSISTGKPLFRRLLGEEPSAPTLSEIQSSPFVAGPNYQRVSFDDPAPSKEPQILDQFKFKPSNPIKQKLHQQTSSSFIPQEMHLNNQQLQNQQDESQSVPFNEKPMTSCGCCTFTNCDNNQMHCCVNMNFINCMYFLLYTIIHRVHYDDNRQK